MGQERNEFRTAPDFSVSVTPFEREGSNIKGLARIFFEESFIVNNVKILQGKESLFVAMPSYKTKQTDGNGKSKYQEVCYPVTKEFREKLYKEIISAYVWETSKEKKQNNNNSHKGHENERQDTFGRRSSIR